MHKREGAALAALFAAGAAFILALTLAAVLIPFRDSIGAENVTILYTAIAVGGALAGGMVGGIISAAIAALCYNFFFTTPYLSLKIDSASQVVTVLLLFAAGALASIVAHLYRERLGGEHYRSLHGLDATTALIAELSRDHHNGRDVTRHALERLDNILDAHVAIRPTGEITGGPGRVVVPLCRATPAGHDLVAEWRIERIAEPWERVAVMAVGHALERQTQSSTTPA